MSDDIFSPPETEKFQPQLPPASGQKSERRKRRVNKRAGTDMSKPKRTYRPRTSKVAVSVVVSDPFKPLLALIDAYKAAPSEVKAVFKKIFG